jgi:DUF4097 and DUF4098 domain-containing protein YvlB
MPIRTVLLTFFCFGAALAVAQGVKQDVKIDRAGDGPVEAKFAAAGRIRMAICPGGITVIGSDEPVVRVTPGHGDVRVRISIFGDEADVRLTGCPNSNFRARIEVPKSSALRVRMFAGQLDVTEVTGDKNIELTFGQLNIDAGKPEEYASVDASVSSGAIDAETFDVHKGGLFRSFEQSGPGKYRLHAHVGAGQIELR